MQVWPVYKFQDFRPVIVFMAFDYQDAARFCSSERKEDSNGFYIASSRKV